MLVACLKLVHILGFFQPGFCFFLKKQKQKKQWSSFLEQFGDKAGETRLRWDEHVQRRDSSYIAAMLEEKRKTTEPVCGCGEGGHEAIVVAEEEASDRVTWRQMIRCGDT